MTMNPSHWIDFLTSQSLHLAVLFIMIGLLTLLVRKQSAHLRYLLWLVVLVKCLVPPLWTIPMAILPQQAEPTIATPQPIAMSEVSKDIPVATSPLSIPSTSAPMIEVGVNPPVTQEVVAEPVLQSASPAWFERIDREQGMLWLWLAGTVLLLLITLYRVTRFGRWIRRMRRPLSQALLGDIESLGSGFEPPLHVQVYTLDGISQPFVWGLWRGSIYLPANFGQSGSSSKRSSVLLHEMAHVRRLDPLVNLIQILVQAVYWFHPFVWITNRLIRAEREKCCDEIAIAKLKTTPKDYGSAIVETLVQEYQSRHAVPTLAVAGPVKNLEDRIKTIMKPGKRFYPRPSFKALLVTLLLAVIAVPTTVALTQRSQAIETETEETAGKQATSREPLPMEQFDELSKNHALDSIESLIKKQGGMSKSVLDALEGSNKQDALNTIEHMFEIIDEILACAPNRLDRVEINHWKSEANRMSFELDHIRRLVGFNQFDDAGQAIQVMQQRNTVLLQKIEQKAIPSSQLFLATLEENITKENNPHKKLHYLLSACSMICEDIADAVKDDDFDMAVTLCKQVDQHIAEGLVIADQVQEGAMFKTLASEFEQWEKAIKNRDKEQANKLGVLLQQTGYKVVPLIEKMAEEIEKEPKSALSETEVRRASSAPQQTNGTRVGGYSLTLESGLHVELLGVSPHHASQESWWSPDGRWAVEAPFDDSGRRVYPGEQEKGYDFALRFSNIPDGLASVFRIDSSGSSAGGSLHSTVRKNGQGCSVYQGGRLVETVAHLAALLDVSRTTCDMKVALAYGPWQLLSEEGLQGGSSESSEQGGVIWAKPYEEKGQARMTVTDTLDRGVYNVRLVAMTNTSGLVTPSFIETGGVGNATQSTATFDVPLAETHSFQIQIREYQWATFENVSLVSKIEDSRGNDAFEVSEVAISNDDRQELERLTSVLYQVSFLNQWQRAEEIIDFESEQQKQRYMELVELQAEKLADSVSFNGQSVQVVRMDLVEPDRVMVSALFPHDERYVFASIVWAHTNHGWRQAVDDIEESIKDLEMSISLTPKEFNLRVTQQRLVRWQHADGPVLQRLYDEDRIKLQHGIQMIQYVKENHLEGMEELDEVECQRALNDIVGKTPQEYCADVIRRYRDILEPFQGDLGVGGT